MPRRRRRDKRRAPAGDAWILWACDGEIPADTPENEDLRSDWLGYEYFSSDEEIATMWRDHGDRAIEAWVAKHPGTRSKRWWTSVRALTPQAAASS